MPNSEAVNKLKALADSRLDRFARDLATWTKFAEAGVLDNHRANQLLPLVTKLESALTIAAMVGLMENHNDA